MTSPFFIVLVPLLFPRYKYPVLKVAEFVPAVIVRETPVETTVEAKAFNVTVPSGMALVVLHERVAEEAADKTGISHEVEISTAVPEVGVLTRTTLSVVSLEATVRVVLLAASPAMVKAYPREGHPSAG